MALPDSASSVSFGLTSRMPSQIARASDSSLAAMLYIAPWGLTWQSGTPAAVQNALSAPIWYWIYALTSAGVAAMLRRPKPIRSG